MWMSVPQMAVLRMRISTSLGPGSGRGSSPSQIPGSGFDLINAFMPASCVDDADFRACLPECRDCLCEHRPRMRRAHLGANARLTERDDRIGKANCVDAELEQAVRHAHRERGVTDH